jgi:hypothetical protein
MWSSRAQNTNITGLKTVSSVGWKAENDNIVCICIFQKLEGAMGVVTIKNKKAWFSQLSSLCSSLSLIILAQPQVSHLLVHPTIDCVGQAIEADISSCEPYQYYNQANSIDLKLPEF